MLFFINTVVILIQVFFLNIRFVVNNQEMANSTNTSINETGFSSYFYGTYMNSQFNEKLSTNPHFYITYGPPASGKATIMEKVLEKHNKTLQTVVEINVDDIVKSFPSYENKRKKLSRKYSSEPTKLKKKNQELYMSCRRELADNASDTLLDKALLRRHDIVWETNGNSIAWTVKEAVRIRKLGYEVILVYPYVKRSSLIERARQRRTQESAPEEQIIRAADLAQLHLPKLISYVDRVYIYDNNGKRGAQNLLLEISHEYSGTNYNIENAIGEPRAKKSRFTKAMKESEYTGHVYVVECHVECDGDANSVIIARDDGQETHLLEMINQYCCRLE